MITSSEEYAYLRQSRDSAEIKRTLWDNAHMDTWYEIVDLYPQYRIFVASNATLPLEILTYLARDESFAVRRAVAMRSDLSDDLRWELFNDEEADIRSLLIERKTTPWFWLAWAHENDPDQNIRDLAARKLVNRSRKKKFTRQDQLLILQEKLERIAA